MKPPLIQRIKVGDHAMIAFNTESLHELQTVDGIVTSIDDNFIHLKKETTTIPIPLDRLNEKTVWRLTWDGKQSTMSRF